MSDTQMSDPFKEGRVPYLATTGFTDWWEFVKDILGYQDLLDHVNGDSKQPSLEKDARDWQKKDYKAMYILRAAVGKDARPHLLGISTSYEMLTKLRGIYQPPQTEKAHTLLKEFHNHKVTKSLDLSASKLTQLQAEIGAASEEERPSDALKKTILIEGLPSGYQSAVYALEAAGITSMSFEDIVQRLKKVEQSIEKTEDREDVARLTRGQKNEKKFKDKCFGCGKPGHIRKDCQALSSGSAKDVKGKAWTAQYHAGLVHTKNSNEWVLDSGCTKHMTFERSHFLDLQDHQGIVTIANRENLQVQGIGTVDVPIQGKKTQIRRVLYVPELGYSLLSVSQLADRDMCFQFRRDKVVLTREGKQMATAERRGNAYVLCAQVQEEGKKTLPTSEKPLLWHQRLGHPGQEKSRLLATSEAVTGLPRDLGSLEACGTCKTSKSTQVVNRQPAARATEPLERIHVDFWGPSKYETLSAVFGSKHKHSNHGSRYPRTCHLH